MSAPPSTGILSANPAAQRKKKLPTAGVNILKDFFNHVSHDPSHAQQQALLEQIHPIDPTFEPKHLASCFPTSFSRDLVSSAGRTQLNPEQIKHLTTLYNADKNPTLQLAVVTEWITERNKPPSPAPTVSPEPPFSNPPFCIPAFDLSPPVRPTLSPILPPALPRSTSSEDTYKMGWLTTFSQFDAETTEPTGPMTRERLNELFTPHQRNIKSFLGKVKTGEMRHQGYTPGIYVYSFVLLSGLNHALV
ncbi:uncharacterized protein EV420DRAFT_1539969 [Desarmillaria tabescens]|uniref:Uncharacterized protein n=1 Tax=Armillaria tabescens TaxID=1929756 RepID=A0AA39N6P0_ARMTA|nr:uncharacterized protein EV420DRAFT_1539969 [Desarmillaria tabescens]KAK0459394.1 hypothetical protein EV420DRAFT_1539969 [Desarmillaria tabescens]